MHSICITDKFQAKFTTSTVISPSDFIFNTVTGLLEWPCPRIFNTDEFGSFLITISVKVEDCLGRSVTKSISITCTSEELTFNNPTDIDRIFFFYKSKSSFREPLTVDSGRQITLRPAFFNYVFTSPSTCTRQTTSKDLDSVTVNTLQQLVSVADTVTTTAVGSDLILSKHPNFDAQSARIVIYRYQLTRGGVTTNSDSVSLNLQSIDFTSNLPYFDGIPSPQTVLTSTSYSFNPCKY